MVCLTLINRKPGDKLTCAEIYQISLESNGADFFIFQVGNYH